MKLQYRCSTVIFTDVAPEKTCSFSTSPLPGSPPGLVRLGSRSAALSSNRQRTPGGNSDNALPGSAPQNSAKPSPTSDSVARFRMQLSPQDSAMAASLADRLQASVSDV